MRVSIAFATQEQPTREHTPDILMEMVRGALYIFISKCRLRRHPPVFLVGILSRRLEDTDRPRPHRPLTMDAGPSRNMWPDPH